MLFITTYMYIYTFIYYHIITYYSTIVILLYLSRDSLAHSSKLFQKPKSSLVSFTNTKAPLLGPIFCTSSFADHSDKSQLRLTSGHSLRVGSTLTWMARRKGQPCCMEDAASHVACPVRKQRIMDAGIPPTSSFSVSRPWDGVTHIQRNCSPLSYLSLEIHSRTGSKVGIQRDTKSHLCFYQYYHENF